MLHVDAHPESQRLCNRLRQVGPRHLGAGSVALKNLPAQAGALAARVTQEICVLAAKVDGTSLKESASVIAAMHGLI